MPTTTLSSLLCPYHQPVPIYTHDSQVPLVNNIHWPWLIVSDTYIFLHKSDRYITDVLPAAECPADGMKHSAFSRSTVVSLLHERVLVVDGADVMMPPARDK